MERLESILDGSRENIRVQDELAAIRLLLDRLPGTEARQSVVVEKSPAQDFLDSKSDLDICYYAVCGRFMDDEPEDAPKPGDPEFRQDVLARTARNLDHLIKAWQSEQDAA